MIGSAVVPTMIANEFFMPKQLLFLKKLDEEFESSEPSTSSGD